LRYASTKALRPAPARGTCHIDIDCRFIAARYAGAKERTMTSEQSRRNFIQLSLAAGGFAGITGCAAGGGRDEQPGEHEKREKEEHAEGGEEDVSPAEDLMREHGVLKRVLLVYREGIRRLDAKEDLPPETIADAAKIIRVFIEDYHEKLEEDHLFPRFRKANTLVELVDVLTAQHQAGRRVTDTTMHLATMQGLRDPEDRRRLVDSMKAFIRMYEPHEAREDTVLFPALHKIVTPHEYDSLGEDFEKKEHELFGEEGFEKYVDQVAEIEKKLGIYDLAQFTPRG
jgi:hemerythrin-like domain-containing protein